MSGKFALAVEEAKRFRQSLANVWDVLEYVANMEHPEALDARIKSLRAESQNLIASYRKQAEDEAEKSMKAKVEASDRKIKQLMKECEEDCKTRVNQAQAQANDILARARQAADQLDARVKAAQAHVSKAMNG
jgi:acetolactate synthase small subunit